MRRVRLLRMMQAASSCKDIADRSRWKYFSEEDDSLNASEELTNIDEEIEDDTIVDQDGEQTSGDKSEQTDINEGYGLGRLCSYLCAKILENTITEMRIMEQYMNDMRIQNVMIDMSCLKAKKYGVKQPTAEDKLEKMDLKNISVSEYKIKELFAVRSYITEVMISLYKELTLNKRFTSLDTYVKETTLRNNYLASLRDNENKYKIRAKELYKKLRQERNRFTIELYEKQIIIYTLQTNIKDFKLYSGICNRYVDNWEDSRTAQHAQITTSAEIKQAEAAESFKQKFNHEYRIHSELEAFLNGVIHETFEKIEEQIDKYEKDMEAIDLKIQIRKYDYLSTYEYRIHLEETVKKHDEFINKWIQYRKERQKAHIYHEKMFKSACTIQAWWRGLLVRLQFGPYTVRDKTKKIRRR